MKSGIVPIARERGYSPRLCQTDGGGNRGDGNTGKDPFGLGRKLQRMRRDSELNARTASINLFKGPLRFPIVVLGLVMGSGILGSWILSPRNGLEPYDDALHILAAMQEPDGAFFYHQFPWHWHTRPFYLLAGEDIGNFRVIGWVVLVLSSSFLAWSLLSLTSQQNRSTLAQAIPLYVVLATGTLTYYSGMFRSPSYNWVTVVGSLLFLGGFFYFVSTQRRGFALANPAVWFSLLASSFGIFFSLPSKPTTAFFLWILAVLILPTFGMLRMTPIFTLGLFGGSVLWFLLSRLFGIWPPQALDVLIGAASRSRRYDYDFFPDCTISQPYGVRRAFAQLICVPERFAIELASQPRSIIVMFAAGIALTAIGKAFERRTDVVSKLGALIVVVNGLIVASSPSFSLGRYDPAQRWILSEQTTGAVLVWLGVLGFTSSSVREKIRLVQCLLMPALALGGLALFRLSSVETEWSIFLAWAVMGSLVLSLGGAHLFALRPGRADFFQISWPEKFRTASSLPYFWSSAAVISVMFIVGFGSSLGPYRLAPIATVFGFAGAALLVLRLSHGKNRQIGLASLVSGSVIISTLVLADGHARPYGVEPLRSQTIGVTLMSQQKPLFLDEELANSYLALMDEAKMAGWENGTPLVDFSRWGFVGPLILDAEVIPSLSLSLDWNAEIAQINLASAEELSFDFKAAWILTSEHEFIPAAGPDELMAVISAYNVQTGMKFPDGFDLVSDVGGFSLWKPRAH